MPVGPVLVPAVGAAKFINGERMEIAVRSVVFEVAVLLLLPVIICQGHSSLRSSIVILTDTRIRSFSIGRAKGPRGVFSDAWHRFQMG